MALILDGISAYEYWMSGLCRDPTTLLSSHIKSIMSLGSPPCRDIEAVMRRTDGVPSVMHLLVDAAESRRSTRHVITRAWGCTPCPKDSLYDLGGSIYVVAPELCAVRLATVLNPVELARAITDLCGIYVLSFFERTSIIEREMPITDPNKIHNFIDNIPGVRGVRRVRRVLPYIVARSASPRETSMNLTLRLPSRSGGHGLPPFEANERIYPTKLAAPLTTKSYLVPDVLWRASRLAVEYNSSKYHNTEESQVMDFEKITALEAMGYTVVPISTRQFNDYDVFKSAVQSMRAVLGVRDRYADTLDEKRRLLHDKLLRIERQQRESASLSNTAVWQYLCARLDVA